MWFKAKEDGSDELLYMQGLEYLAHTALLNVATIVDAVIKVNIPDCSGSD